MSDIVERLRERQLDPIFGRYRINALHDEAADEIERQAKSIEEAMTQLAFRDDEIERLRELLREAVLGPSQFPDWYIRRALKTLGKESTNAQ